MSDDEEEEVESRFRGTPHAVTNFTAAKFKGSMENATQPLRFAGLKTHGNDEAALTSAALQNLAFPSKTLDSVQKTSCALTDHGKDMPSNWLDSLRHRKQACPFANDKTKQNASLPSTPRKPQQAAGGKRQQQVQTTLPSMFCRAAPRKTRQNAFIHPDEKSSPKTSHQRGESLPQEMKACKLSIPQTSPRDCNKRSSEPSQQGALEILMTGKLGT